jgi:hypothetical protein
MKRKERDSDRERARQGERTCGGQGGNPLVKLNELGDCR